MIPIAVEVEGNPQMIVIAPDPVQAAGFAAPAPNAEAGEAERQSRIRCICQINGKRFDQVLLVRRLARGGVKIGPGGQMVREPSVQILSTTPFEKLDNWQGMDQVEHFMHKLGVAAVRARAEQLGIPAPLVHAQWEQSEEEGGDTFTMTLTLRRLPLTGEAPADAG